MAKRVLTEADIIPNAEYARTRSEWRKKITDKKRNRRVDVGPYITFYFESLRDHVAAGAGDGLHRKRRRRADPRRTGSLQSTDPERIRTDRDIHDRDRRTGPAQAHPGRPGRDRGDRVPPCRRRDDRRGAGSRRRPHLGRGKGFLGPVRAFPVHRGSDRGILITECRGRAGLQPPQLSAIWRS